MDTVGWLLEVTSRGETGRILVNKCGVNSPLWYGVYRSWWGEQFWGSGVFLLISFFVFL